MGNYFETGRSLRLETQPNNAFQLCGGGGVEKKQNEEPWWQDDVVIVIAAVLIALIVVIPLVILGVPLIMK